MEVRAQELACSEKWLHQDHFADLLVEIELIVKKKDCEVSWIDWHGVEVGAQELACAEKWLH